jgi:hypothetical protein
MEDQLLSPNLRLTVSPESLVLFTTVLQSGIELNADVSVSLGMFLHQFPGFTAEYLAESVQTIFLNGTAVDDLTLPFTGTNPVLALSAAMPGLAGAIFRRNSFHSALRTDTNTLESSSIIQESITVTLKLFNSIARDRGGRFLERGVCIKGAPLASFLLKRPSLMQKIEQIEFDNTKLNAADLLKVLPEQSKVNLKIVTKDG